MIGVDAMEGVFPQDDQTDTPTPAEATKSSAHTEVVPTDAMGTSSAPPPVKFMPPRLRGIPPNVMLISQAAWKEVVTKLAILATKVGHMDGRVRSWMDW